jgi:hypothetical protein
MRKTCKIFYKFKQNLLTDSKMEKVLLKKCLISGQKKTKKRKRQNISGLKLYVQYVKSK